MKAPAALALLLCAAVVRAQGDPDARARELFARPLIIGASVSASFRAPSPGHLLAQRFGGSALSRAVPGAAGALQVARLDPAEAAAASAVVGLDLFFWDSRRDCGAGLAAVDGLFRKTGATPVVLGNIPSFGLPEAGDGSSCREQLNARLAAACSAAPDCALLDFDALWRRAVSPGIEHGGRLLHLGDLLADGLHLGPDGSAAAAESLLRLLRGPRPVGAAWVELPPPPALAALCRGRRCHTRRAGMAIDTDGWIKDAALRRAIVADDPWHQDTTSLQLSGQRPPDLDPTVVPYVVIPKSGFPHAAVGDLAVVEFGGRRLVAVVGDLGPVAKFGEGSWRLATDFGIPNSGRTGGVADGVTYTFLDGTAAPAAEEAALLARLAALRAELGLP